MPRLIHLLDQGIDLILTIAQIAAFNEMLELAGAKAAGWVAQLEGPEEVAGLLEVGADGEDLVDQVFHADDAVFAQVVLDQLVVREGDALLIDLAVAALVNEVAYRFDRGEAVRDVGFHYFQHFRCRFGEPHEYSVIDLQQAQQLEYLAGFRGNFVDTVGVEEDVSIQL